MSKRVKWTLIIAACTAALGLLLSGMGLLLMGGEAAQATYTRQSRSFSADTAAIRVEPGSADVRLYPVSGDEIVLTWYDSEGQRFRIDDAGGGLAVRRESTGKSWAFSIHLWGNETPDYLLEIGIPADYAGTLDISGGSGDIDARELTLSGDLTLHTGSGDMALESLGCRGSVDISTSSGKLELRELEADGALKLETSSGGVSGRDVTCASLELRGASGGVDFAGVTADTVSLRTTSGDLRLDGIDVSQALVLEAASGEIRCTLPDGMDAYAITSRTGSGDNDLPRQADYGDKVLDVTTASGDIRFRFNG